MEYWFQGVFLEVGKRARAWLFYSIKSLNDRARSRARARARSVSAIVLAVAFYSHLACSQEAVEASDLNQEVFELGLFTGIINIGDFNSEWVVGISASFQASEDFFIQYNYLQTDADLSSFEQSQGQFFSGDDRTFIHYDLLVGYNLFQGEIYSGESQANLSSFYLVGGVGDTRFGGESSFTLTIGAGYQITLARRYVLHVDYRNYIYESSLIRSEETTTNNAQFSIGLNYLF